VILVANEWGTVGSGGEQGFFSSHSVNKKVILISSPPESSCILSVWQSSAEVEREGGAGSSAKGALKLSYLKARRNPLSQWLWLVQFTTYSSTMFALFAYWIGNQYYSFTLLPYTSND
jgi:hypothetical protein